MIGNIKHIKRTKKSNGFVKINNDDFELIQLSL